MAWPALFPAPPTPITGAGILLRARSSRRVLLLQKPGGAWETPGGHLEPGESPLRAALRELHEETGWGGQVTIDSAVNTATDYRLFLGTVDGEFEPRLSHEHSAAMWAGRDNLPKPLHPGLRGVL